MPLPRRFVSASPGRSSFRHCCEHASLVGLLRPIALCTALACRGAVASKWIYTRSPARPPPLHWLGPLASFVLGSVQLLGPPPPSSATHLSPLLPHPAVGSAPSATVMAGHVFVVDRPLPKLLVTAGPPSQEAVRRTSQAAVSGCPWRACQVRGAYMQGCCPVAYAAGYLLVRFCSVYRKLRLCTILVGHVCWWPFGSALIVLDCIILLPFLAVPGLCRFLRATQKQSRYEQGNRGHRSDPQHAQQVASRHRSHMQVRLLCSVTHEF